jgi:hypothetical protein
VVGRVPHERLQNLGSGSVAAGMRGGCHSADSPVTELFALGTDQPDRDELVALEHAERDGVARLVLGKLVDVHVRPQDVAPERAGLRERDRAEIETRHFTQGMRI